MAGTRAGLRGEGPSFLHKRRQLLPYFLVSCLFISSLLLALRSFFLLPNHRIASHRIAFVCSLLLFFSAPRSPFAPAFRLIIITAHWEFAVLGGPVPSHKRALRTRRVSRCMRSPQKSVDISRIRGSCPNETKRRQYCAAAYQRTRSRRRSLPLLAHTDSIERHGADENSMELTSAGHTRLFTVRQDRNPQHAILYNRCAL